MGGGVHETTMLFPLTDAVTFEGGNNSGSGVGVGSGIGVGVGVGTIAGASGTLLVDRPLSSKAAIWAERVPDP